MAMSYWWPTDKHLRCLSYYLSHGICSLVGENAKFQSFHGSRCTIRRKDGATYFTDISPYAFLLFEHFVLKQWDQAIRLCRYAKDNILWACLAAMAVDSKELNTAEMAYAALNEVDKVHYMLHVKDLPSEDARQAELADRKSVV